SPEGAPFRVTIRLIATPWNENTVNWVYAQSMNFAATDMNPNNKVPITGSYVDFDVTDIVQTWIENRGKYGFYIKCYDESGNNKSALFHSRESTSTDKRPDLEIKYTQ
ncbi:MAG TPA: DNRLRE domain-containing protein, partial [bacterium]